MVMDAVQSGWNQLNLSEQDISQLLLIYGTGILTYEIVSKAVNKIASEQLPKGLVKPLATSVFIMICANKMDLPKLQVNFIALCILYVGVSIWAARNSANASSLPAYMVDMVEEAKRGAYLPKIGYEEAVKRLEVSMNTASKSNAILLANPGVGKSTIPETIACKIATGQYPAKSPFFNAKLISVNFTDLMAGTMYQGSLEQRVHEMVQLAKKDPKVIYFIDEIHMLVGAGGTIEWRIDISKLLYPVMARGEIRIIGASTLQDYSQHILPKPAFARRLPQVNVYEPNTLQCFQMLQHSYRQISEKGRIKISDDAIKAAIFFSKDIPQRYFPDKAIELIDDAISDAEIHDETEDDLDLTERHIAKAFCSKGINKIETVLLSYEEFCQKNANYFSVSLDEKVD